MTLRIKYYSLLIPVLLILISCQPGKPWKDESKDKTEEIAKNDSFSILNNRVMDVHNKSMESMDTLMKLKAGLKLILDKTAKSSSDNDSVETNIRRLQQANDAMMDWMHAYKKPEMKEDSLGNEKSKKYFKDQLSKIQNVNNQMQESIRLAAEALANAQKK